MHRKTIAGLVTVGALAIALVACSSGDKNNAGAPAAAPTTSAGAPASPETAEKATEASPSLSKSAEGTGGEGASSAEAPVASGSGDVSVIVDGKAVEVTDKVVLCQEAAGNMNIVVGSAAGSDAIGAVLTTGDNPEVKSIGLGSVNGTAMGWAEGAPGNAKAAKKGKTYDISGSLMAVDMANPTAPAEKSFELKVTCP